MDMVRVVTARHRRLMAPSVSWAGSGPRVQLNLFTRQHSGARGAAHYLLWLSLCLEGELGLPVPHLRPASRFS